MDLIEKQQQGEPHERNPMDLIENQQLHDESHQRNSMELTELQQLHNETQARNSMELIELQQLHNKTQERNSMELIKLQYLHNVTHERNSTGLIEHQHLRKETHTMKPLEKNQHLLLWVETTDPGNPIDILVEGLQQKVTRADINKLDGLNWLGDVVINFYMNLLAERAKEKGMPQIYAFHSFFMTKLLKTGHTGVKRWTKNIDIFSMDLILVPVHLGIHWCIAIIE